MNKLPDAELTITELAEAVQQRLEQAGLMSQQDRRVSALPDPRTIRYYTTLGLLSPPRIQSRQARYAQRHVLQLAAIKALQIQSLSLAAIQARLLGRSPAELEQLLQAIAAQNQPKTPDWQPVPWLEVTLLPGVRLLVDAEVDLSEQQDVLLERARQALEYLNQQHQRRKR